ncbi:MAG: matrixin family metalloprotease [Candidatus Melainabacteria bacterium]|nr:matrixin family metalloprotease [Candidatus Melainabacteria bacterium]
MIRKSIWPVALLVPFFIVAVVWSVAAAYLIPTHPSDSFLANSAKSSSIEEKIFCQQFGSRGYAPSLVPNQQGGMPTANLDNYLAAISQDGSFRWSADRMPIDVYIADGGAVPGYRAEYRKMIADAFNEWCNNSRGLLKWRQVNDPRQADVVCTWTNNPTIKPGSVEAGQTRTLVQTNRDTGEGRIVTAQISILTELMGRQFSNENMYKTCLHEVGHALGLQGHSDVPSDIMYPTVNQTQIAKLKSRDLNTLTRLYEDTRYTASNSNGMPQSSIGDILPFTGSGASQANRRSAVPFFGGGAPIFGSVPSFGNGGQQFGQANPQSMFGPGGLQSFFGNHGTQRFNGVEPNRARQYDGNAMQQANSEGIRPFAGGNMQGSDDGSQGFNNGSGQDFNNDGNQGFNNGDMQNDAVAQGSNDDGIQPFTGGGMQQTYGGAGGAQWQSSPRQGYRNSAGGWRQHHRGNWAQQAALRELMRRSAQQNNFYN